MQVMPDLASLSLHCRTVALERRLRRRWFAPATRVRVLEPQAGEPPPVHQRPGRSAVVMTMRNTKPESCWRA